MVILKDSKIEFPNAVAGTLDFFESNNIWYILSQNKESRSCRDAVQKRYRLGNIGIPLHDELKSYFGKFLAKNKINYVAIHCRGDQELDFNKIKDLLKIETNIERLSSDEIYKYLGLAYGTINPFTIDQLIIREHKQVLQIWDNSIFLQEVPPYTMMTNAGDLHWGIEFKPTQLYETIDNKRIGDIVKDSSAIRSKKQQKIGIITGNSPESGIKLWTDFNNGVRRLLSSNFRGDISFPNVLISSVPEMGMSMELELREEDTWMHIEKALKDLCEQECTMIAFACNTTQYFKDRVKVICNNYNATLFTMEQAVEKFLKKNNISKFDFLAISYVTDFNYWSGFKGLNDKFDIVVPPNSEVEKINNIAYQVKQKGITGQSINKLRDIINQATTTNTVLIGLTELSIILDSQKKKSKSGKVFIDTLELLANEMVSYYLKKDICCHK